MSCKSKPALLALFKVIQTLTERRFRGHIIIRFKDGEPIVISPEEPRNTITTLRKKI